jgi:cytochrome d ubiquinol oxidase subunit II
MFLLLWTLILRGISMEFRSHIADSMWRGFFDAVFSFASILMPVLLGAALGNVLRGVPLDEQGTFGLALFTDFTAHSPVGILDWYTVTAGVLALVLITAHGALFLAWKTEGAVHERCVRLAPKLWIAATILWALTTWATDVVNHAMYAALAERPLAWAFGAVAVAGFASVWIGMRSARFGLAFAGSCAFILGLLATTAACVFPVMLRAIDVPARSLTADNAVSSNAGLTAGLWWWLIGFPIAIAYFVILMRYNRGKVTAARDGEGY